MCRLVASCCRSCNHLLVRARFPMEYTPLLVHLREPERGRRNLSALASAIGSEQFQTLLDLLVRVLPRSSDADRALNNLERYLVAAPNSLSALLEHGGQPLESLLQLLGASQFFADALVANPDFFEMLRVPLRQSPSPEELRQKLEAAVWSAADDSEVLQAFRQFRQRQMLRIGANDVIRDRPLEEVTRDLSQVADAALQVALTKALQGMNQRFGSPTDSKGQSASSVLLAFGKLGGMELNYSSDIDLMFIFDQEGMTRGSGPSISNDEFFTRVLGEVVRLLSAHTAHGFAYRIDLRLRPEGKRGPLARS